MKNKISLLLIAIIFNGCFLAPMNNGSNAPMSEKLGLIYVFNLIYDNEMNPPVQKTFSETKEGELFIIPKKDEQGKSLVGLKNTVIIKALKLVESGLIIPELTTLQGWDANGPVVKWISYPTAADLISGTSINFLNNTTMKDFIAGKYVFIRLELLLENLNGAGGNVLYKSAMFVLI